MSHMWDAGGELFRLGEGSMVVLVCDMHPGVVYVVYSLSVWHKKGRIFLGREPGYGPIPEFFEQGDAKGWVVPDGEKRGGRPQGRLTGMSEGSEDLDYEASGQGSGA